MSDSFVTIDYDHLTFPAKMRVDYIRVYQPKDSINVGCDPADFPTKSYIDQCVGLLFLRLAIAEFVAVCLPRYSEAYWNPNFTTWKQYGYEFPKNSLLEAC